MQKIRKTHPAWKNQEVQAAFDALKVARWRVGNALSVLDDYRSVDTIVDRFGAVLEEIERVLEETP